MHLPRHLANPSWLSKKAYLWGRSALSLKKDDVFCAFYPKTGSTWVRIFMFNLLSAKKHAADDGFTFDQVNFSMPEWGHISLFSPWQFDNCPRLIKVHRPCNWLFRNNPSIVFAREPRDVMVSLLHYATAKKQVNFSGDLEALVHNPEFGLETYMEFYQSWLKRSTLCVKYEDLRSKPHETFKQFLDAIEVPATDAEIATALDASSMDNTRKAQESSSQKFKDKFQSGFVFARKGATGEGVSLFDEQLNEYYLRLRDRYEFDLYPFEPASVVQA